MAAMIIVGRFANRIDARLFITLGLVLITYSMWEMTLFTTEVTAWDIIRTGLVQGTGLGFIFVPLSTISFATLDPKYRNEGTSMFSLLRNIGSSIGISVVTTYLAQRTQINHAAFADYINPFNLGLQIAQEQGAYNTTTAAGLAALNQVVTGQAATLAYLQDFRLMMWVTVAALPLVFLLKGKSKQATA